MAANKPAPNKPAPNKPAPSKPVTRGGALSTSPSNKPSAANKPADGLKRLSPGVYRNPQGQLVNSSGKRIDSRGRPVKLPPTKQAPTNKPVGTPEAPVGTPEAAFRGLTPEGQIQETGTDALALANEAYAREMERMRQGQPDFSGQLESARQQAAAQFERTMGPEFERQQMQLRQRMAEQGIDPNSGAYQAQMKMLNDAQSNARQNSMDSAFQRGAEYQQQQFTQDVTGRTLPFQFAQMGADAWKLPYAATTQAEQAALDRKAQLQAARSGGGSAVRAAQIQADAARDVAAMERAQGWSQPQRPSAGSSLAQGLGTGAGAAAVNYITR